MNWITRHKKEAIVSRYAVTVTLRSGGFTNRFNILDRAVDIAKHYADSAFAVRVELLDSQTGEKTIYKGKP